MKVQGQGRCGCTPRKISAAFLVMVSSMMILIMTSTNIMIKPTMAFEIGSPSSIRAFATSSRRRWSSIVPSTGGAIVTIPARSASASTSSSALRTTTNPSDQADVPLECDVFVGVTGNEDGDDDADLRYAATMQMTDIEEIFFNFLESFLQMIPIFIPLVAYMTYDPLAQFFADTLEMIANRNWVAVDGGAYQAKIIAPAINGVVVPSISILFATLIGTTISTLRERQATIEMAINVEAGQLRMLQSLLDSISTVECDTNRCRYYMMQYVSRLIAESQSTVIVQEMGGSLDSELNGVLKELNKFALKDTLPGTILGQSYSACSKLYEERAKRVTALRSGFPMLHYVIVSALAMSICLAFLLESNQQLLVFLNAIQLRILWTMLLGTFSALAIVCYDLIEPFRGSYQVSHSVDQLYTIRLALGASLGELDD